MTTIINPIYDVAFKYLMEDSKIARLLLSDLTGLDIESIELQPQEYTSQPEKLSITIYRMDFKAKVKDKRGRLKLVLIEIQKAKFYTDILRFRKYLGEQYAHTQNVIDEDGQKVGIPIITIYFLGYRLGSDIDIPIIKVARQVLDKATEEVIKVEDVFIESLTHDSIIVQVPLLRAKRRNELELALSIFDEEGEREISIKEEEYPERYREIIRRLKKAVSDTELRRQMEMEDEIIEEFKIWERKQLEAKEAIEQERQRTEQERQRAEQKEKELEQERQRAEQKEKELEQERQRAEQKEKELEQERQRAEQERILKEQKEKELEQERLRTVNNLYKKGFSYEQISEITGLSLNMVKKLLKIVKY